MSSFFDDQKDIKLAVHEAIGDFIGRHDFSGWIRGNSVADTTPLFEEITRLTKQRNDFEAQLGDLKKVSRGVAQAEAEQVNLNELASVLKSIEIETNLFNEQKEAITYDLYTLFTALSDDIIAGVMNKPVSDDLNKFLYYNVCTKLQIYGLVKNEKVASVQWRMYCITPLGERFLAFIQREKIKNNNG